MPTKSTQITGPTLIASGEQNVTINFKRGVGEFYVLETNTAPDAGDHGAYLGIQPESMALDADQFLFVDGTGTLVVIARNPAI
ncbi:hypothetical protein [Roseobacter sp. OBYS 0001]|uniref:hypothetical protein n=1 Tax=Roseobacter sp. OBYS 0001 TaxID=882651 RepID=UPI001BBE6F31|nr:hypothetical protein [Roseobacter sp. OBYS 0001]GIT85452.1 hypothetical protein ROBYS_04680 [Roseobacter sp. OBYS 0001]